MTFDYTGYELKFIQKSACNDKSAHEFSLLYKFHSPVTKLNYVLRAEYHQSDVFAIKFYCKKDKSSDFKYSKIVNRGDIGNILVTCSNIVPILLEDYPTASFAFGAARSVDKRNNWVESHFKNQRFSIYKHLAFLKFGNITFTHFEYPQISCYMLVNNLAEDITDKEKCLIAMFSETYTALHDLG